MYNNSHLIHCPEFLTGRAGKVFYCLFLFIPHLHHTTLHLPGKDINFLLAVAVFVQQILTLLIHYSQCIVERALRLNGISGDDLISHDWCKPKTLCCNLSPLLLNHFTCTACVHHCCAHTSGLKMTKCVLPWPTVQAPRTCASACMYASKIAINTEKAMLFLLWRAIIFWQPSGKNSFCLLGFD